MPALLTHRETILEHLALAEHHVAEGITQVQYQRARVAILNRDGHFAMTAEGARLLLQSIATLAARTAHRDRLLKELAENSGRELGPESTRN